MATPKVLAMVAVDASTKTTAEIMVDAPYLAEFIDETVFNRKYCMLQAGSNLLPYYGGQTDCRLYTIQEVETALTSLPKPKKPAAQMIHDVPTI